MLGTLRRWLTYGLEEARLFPKGSVKEVHAPL
jgi:hypothetical protein